MLLFHKIIVTALGAGYSPVAPGTAGAVVGVLLAYCLQWLAVCETADGIATCLLGLIFFFLFLGIYSTNQLEPLWGKDPSRVVIDEVVGVWIALLWLPVSWPWWLAAFVLFRFFDIAKPLYIRRVERLPGGWGVMLDDVVAGAYAMLLLNLCYWVVNLVSG